MLQNQMKASSPWLATGPVAWARRRPRVHGGALHLRARPEGRLTVALPSADWPQARRPALGRSRAALHAKLIAADERTALLGSANLTDRALKENLEIGAVLREPVAVRSLVRHFRSLMRPGPGPLEPLG